MEIKWINISGIGHVQFYRIDSMSRWHAVTFGLEDYDLDKLIERVISFYNQPVSGIEDTHIILFSNVSFQIILS